MSTKARKKPSGNQNPSMTTILTEHSPMNAQIQVFPGSHPETLDEMRLRRSGLAVIETETRALEAVAAYVEAHRRHFGLPALGVVMAAGGYPDDYRKGDRIDGLDGVDSGDLKVFHAGTREQDGRVLTSGGRVLCVTALGDSVAAAQARAYQGLAGIHWTDCQYRRDIGYRAVMREMPS